jgi:hypothetical protein
MFYKLDDFDLQAVYRRDPLLDVLTITSENPGKEQRELNAILSAYGGYKSASVFDLGDIGDNTMTRLKFIFHFALKAT